MSGNLSDENSRARLDESDPRFDVWRQNQFTCLTSNGQLDRHRAYVIQRDDGQGPQITLPPISMFKSSHGSLAPYQSASHQQKSNGNQLPLGQPSSPIANDEGKKRDQQKTSYYWDTHPPGRPQPSTRSAYQGSIPPKLRYQPLQSNSSSRAYTLPTNPEAPAILSQDSNKSNASTKNGNRDGARCDDAVEDSGKGGLHHGANEATLVERYDASSTMRGNQASTLAPQPSPSAPQPSASTLQPSASTSQPSTSSSQPFQPSAALLAKRAARIDTMYAKLDAVSGVVIPSTLAPGQAPVQARCLSRGNRPLNLRCPRCKGAYAVKSHVRSHFPACVDRNGNPDGLTWDHGMPTFKGCRVGRKL